MTFAERVVALRDRVNMTQEALADRLGVTRSTVAAWEARADSVPKPDACVKLALLTAPSNPLEAQYFLDLLGISPIELVAAGELLKSSERGEIERVKQVLVPPFTKGRWAGQGGLNPRFIESDLIDNPASVYYVELPASPMGGTARVGIGVAPNDIVVFEIAENYRGEEVVIDRGDWLEIARLARMWHNSEWEIVYLPSDESPANKASHLLHPATGLPLPLMDRPRRTAKLREDELPILGRFIQRSSKGTEQWWKRKAWD